MSQLIAMQRSAGFTLVEVLVTIFVTGVGLLTVAGLQGAAKRVSYEAAQRTLATALAQDMVERIRSNSKDKTSYVTTDAGGAALVKDCSASSTVCSTSELASFDLYQWGRKLTGQEERDSTNTATGGLVNPTGCVRFDAVHSVWRVAIAWRGSSSMDQPASSSTSYDACGVGLGRYTDPSSGTAEAMRRYIFVEFI